jgi:nucleotide-binding universal stress UspA family protein
MTNDEVHQIVVGIDGSDGARAAAAWAASEALRRQAPITLVSCYDIPIYGEPAGFAAEAVTARVAEIKADHDRMLSEAQLIIHDIAESVEVNVVATLDAALPGLTAAATAKDLLVVGATGQTGRFGELFGSVATGVSHYSRCPVVVVHATPRTAQTSADLTGGDRSGTVPARAMTRIIVGVDGSAAGHDALRWAYDEAAMAKAELTVVHSWIYPYVGLRTGVSEPREEMKLDAMRELKACVDTLAPLHDDVKVHATLAEGSPAECLIQAAADADLVVVGSRGRGGLKAMLLGSVSRAVLQHAPCPVAVIRHRESDSGEAG